VIFLKTFSWVVVLTFSWVCCHSLLVLSVLSLTFLSVLSLTFLIVLSILLPIGLTAHFYKGSSSTSVKIFFNISAQPQLLEVEGLGDVGIVKAELRYILCSYFIYLYFSFLTFLWLLYSYENWIDLNCIPLSLYLNIKPQIGLYISTLGSLYSCTILNFQYHHPRTFKGLSKIIFNGLDHPF
jgi:hypothetical protein